jgi:hypothetical protein
MRHTPEVSAEHQVKDEEAVFIILERITHVDNEGMVNLVA